LRRWEELRPELDARGIQIVTLCTDTPAKIREQKSKHGLRAIMLADSDGSVTKTLGIQNQGVHTGPPGGPKLPIPTTVLVDRSGIVRWIDQSKDYQRRSDPDRVHAALNQHLPATA
jgi:peroxiredoxin